VIYLDSSALVKLVLREPESEALSHFLLSHPDRVSSALARVEVVRVVRRIARSAADIERASSVLERVALARLDDAVLASAARLEPAALRSRDAIHLATALSLAPLDAFVVYDVRLSDHARSLGLDVVSPH
jgi:predicted nucleic acid-binding protein